MNSGKFITFEGLDGAGKSTHIGAIIAFLRNHGLTVTGTREPGGTALAEEIRELLLSREMDLDTETLLMFAARQHHINHLILPALSRGEWVVSDRFTDATFAYQGGGRGVSDEKISVLEQWVQSGLQPDLTFVFDLPFEVAQKRIQGGRVLDRFEKEARDFHERVRAAYLKRASDFPARIRIINADQAPDLIYKQVEDAVTTFCL